MVQRFKQKSEKPSLPQSKMRSPTFRAATLNVGTLGEKDAEVVETLTRRKVDLCSLQEIRLKGRDNYEVIGKDSIYKLYKSCDKHDQGGVAIMVARKYVVNVQKVYRSPVTDRIMYLSIVIGKQVYTFFSVYAPQRGLSQAEKDHFYDQLLSALMTVQATDVIIFLGDLNGHVGASADGYGDAHGGQGYSTRNPEGQRILEFALAHNLLVGNTQFIKRDSHLITYTSGNCKSQVDYVLYQKCFRKEVTNVKVIPGEECASQHHLVVCDFTVRPPPKVKRNFAPRLRTWKLKDPTIAQEFYKTFQSKVASAPNRPEDTTPEQAWSNLKTPIIESVKEVCGTSTGRKWRKQTWWWNERVDAAVKAKRAHFKTHRSLRRKGNTPQARAALTAYQDAKRSARHEIWVAKSSAGEEMFRNVDPKGSTVYRIARQMADRNQDVVGEQCVRNDAGEPSLTEEAKMKAWVEHYSRLMNIEFDWPRDKLPNADPVVGDPPTVTTEMIRAALSKMKCGKAAGPSGITAEMLKATGDEGIQLMKELCQLVVNGKGIPSDWEESYIKNLYKGKGDALDRGNYRGLKMTDQAMKLSEHVLEASIRDMVDIDGMQFGFVSGRGTTDAIFIARQIQEKYIARKKPLYLAFVDLEKAFDRIPRDVIWWAMRTLGVEEWAVTAVQSMYANARSRVQVNGEYSEEFPVKVGVHQGSVLSPLLFILVLEALSRDFRTGAPWELLYADDLLIIADSLEKCIARLKAWKDAMEKKGCRVNMSKTKFMISGVGLDVLDKAGKYPCAVCCKNVGSNAIICSTCKLWVHKRCSGIKTALKEDPGYVCPRCQGRVRPIDGRPITEVPVDNTQLEVVDRFVYLGDKLSSGGGCTLAVINRCGIAWGKFRQLLPILTSKHLALTTKGRVYDACVRSAMLHGSETWATRKTDLDQLNRCDRSMMRWICRVGPRDNSPTEQLCAKLGVAVLSSVLRANRLRWFGHVERASSWINKVRNLLVPGNKVRGGQRLTWDSRVKTDITECGLRGVNPSDRNRWRERVRATRLLPTMED